MTSKLNRANTACREPWKVTPIRDYVKSLSLRTQNDSGAK